MRMLMIFVGLCLVFTFVWERVDMVRVGYQIERLKHDKVMLERERDELRVKFSALSAPDRIAKVASEKLGMILPQQGQVIMVQYRSEGAPSSPSAPVEVRIARNDLNGGRR
ncbi:MAG TPA: cell division protein FtsL [Nitrospiraceae bacterium]|nr:cell division protein FtsL [Nitrospiraceae bacterium]